MSTSLFTAEEKRQVRWFVMRAYKNEKMAEDRLKDKEYGLEYFIPKHYAVRTYHGVKSKKLVPVIPSLLFVHASHSQITEFKKRYNFLQFAMWEKSTGVEYITVPDDQMDSFIKELRNQELIKEFDARLWSCLVDFITVYSKDDIRVTFKNGIEY